MMRLIIKSQKQIYTFMASLNKSQSGFTLIEVIVSTLILGIILGIIFFSISTLNFTILSNKDYHSDQKTIMTTLSTIEQDLSSVFIRSIRDELGDFEPALLLTNDNFSQLSFTRSFHNSLLDETKLLRIWYTHNDGQFERRIWNVLDRVQDSSYQVHSFDSKIERIKILAAGVNGEWNEYWPIGSMSLVKNDEINDENRMINRESILQYQALSTRSNSHADVLPLAIKIIIEHSSLGTYERIILL